VGSTVSRPIRTTCQPCPERTDHPQIAAVATLPCPQCRCRRFPAHRFPPPRRRRPPPLVAIKGATPPPPWSTLFFLLHYFTAPTPGIPATAELPQTAAPPPLRPPRPHPEHRATEYDHPTPQAAHHHPPPRTSVMSVYVIPPPASSPPS
jgi:hypothetical protein